MKLSYLLLLLIIFIIICLNFLYVFGNKSLETFEMKPDVFEDFFVNVYDVVYDFPYLFKYDIDQLSNYLQNKNMKILDAGSGVGRHYKVLYDNGLINIIGVDKSRRMINKAMKRNMNGKFEVGDLVDFNNFKEGSFDMIVCFQETIYHNSDTKIKKILHNFNKWLKHGGILAIHVFNTDKLDPAPRDYSQYYTDDHGNKHAITYMNNFIHDAWWEKDGKYKQRVILENGQNKITTLGLNMMKKNALLEEIQLSGFRIKEIKDYSSLNITQYDLYIFTKNK